MPYPVGGGTDRIARQPFGDFAISRIGFSYLLLAALVVATEGCHLLSRQTDLQETLPTVLPPSPTLEQVIAAINNNSARIYNFQTERATISGRDFPSLRAIVVFERPLRLRIRAGTGVTGLEFDLGSNDELFWLWIRRDPNLYFCRHAEFVYSSAGQRFPLDPRWLIDAFGLVELDPAIPHEGPQPVDSQRLRIISRLTSPQGTKTRLVVIDSRTAAVLEQRVYDSAGQLIASATALRHRRDPLTGLVMPQVIQVASPPFELNLQIDLGAVRINRPLEVTGDIWQMPHYEGWTPVDLARVAAYMPHSPQSASPLTPGLWERPSMAEAPSARIKFR